MKIITKTTTYFTLLLMMFFVSCTKDENVIEFKLDLKNKVLTLEEIKLISLKISNLQNFSKVKNNKYSYEIIDYEVEELLSPLVENGKLLHEEMIDYLELTGEFQNMSTQEQNEILNLDNSQLAKLSFVMSASFDERIAIDQEVKACLGVAVGAVGIYDLIVNTAALGTVETTVAALRLIGRRYLGWFGVAMMIYDFYECIDG